MCNERISKESKHEMSLNEDTRPPTHRQQGCLGHAHKAGNARDLCEQQLEVRWGCPRASQIG